MVESPTNEPFAARWVPVQMPVSNFLSACGPEFHEAEDILQQVAITAFERFAEFDPERGTFLSWVLGIARNHVLHWRRSKGRDRHVFSPELIELLAETREQNSGELDGLQSALAQCMEQLDGRTLQALRLRYHDNCKPADIAKRIGTTSGSIRVALTRGRQSLRECIQKKLDWPRE